MYSRPRVAPEGKPHVAACWPRTLVVLAPRWVGLDNVDRDRGDHLNHYWNFSSFPVHTHRPTRDGYLLKLRSSPAPFDPVLALAELLAAPVILLVFPSQLIDLTPSPLSPQPGPR